MTCTFGPTNIKLNLYCLFQQRIITLILSRLDRAAGKDKVVFYKYNFVQVVASLKFIYVKQYIDLSCTEAFFQILQNKNLGDKLLTSKYLCK